MRGDMHVRFGERLGETDREQSRHRAPGLLSGDGACRLAEQDAVSQEGEACASVHLLLDQFGFGVDVFGAAVVEGVGQGGVDGVAVEAEAAGEGMQVG